ncbi:hypothetical protein Rhein_0151 [Rheinheimera sp. A13L]|uniref:hypothetical protein n=1 Tax=Rheinheimera sp. A13L TaxID=506534 RepID=UPI00021249B7|nr:hypothetical protein [Rheinheimera sp. A13L]EGM79691.1 hypothetical protein Rhein_0151 [Rheinheimera sp. A13L]
MRELATTGWLELSLVLLFVLLAAAAVLFVFLRFKRNYWPLKKAPFWFEALQLGAVINAGFFSARLVQIYLLPLF